MRVGRAKETGELVTRALLSFSECVPLDSYLMQMPGGHSSRATQQRYRHFLAGRQCASSALAVAGYVGSWQLEKDVSGLPMWPPGWQGSISHTEGRAVAVVCPAKACLALGVDIERTLSFDCACELSADVAGAAELEILRRLGYQKSMTLLFSAKESIYKALYPKVRQFKEFSAARLVSHEEGCLTFELAESWSADWMQGRTLCVFYSFFDEYVLTMAWEGTCVVDRAQYAEEFVS